MNRFLLVSVIAYCLMALDIVYLFIRLKTKGMVDKSLMDTRFWAMHIAIYVFAIFLVTLCIFIGFSLVAQIGLCGCGVFAFEISSRDFIRVDKD